MAKMNFTHTAVAPFELNLEERVKELIKKVDMTTEAKIKSGFKHTVNDVEYRFSYDSDDQRNFAQQCTAAAISMQLGTMDMDDLKKAYGVDENNELWKAHMPVALPDEFRVNWQAHNDDGSVTGLVLKLQEFLQLANAGADHLKTCLGHGWVVKEQLRACTRQAQVDAVVEQFKIEDEYKQYVTK